jgi:hypothetical protein
MPILTTLGLAAALASAPAPAAAAASDIDPAFSRCLAGLQATAATRASAPTVSTRSPPASRPDPSVLGLLDAQPEFTTPIWDYLAALVDRQRVDDGRALLQQHRDLLDRVSAQYGVDPATIVAVWGVESDYGRVFGKRPLLQSLATLSCAGRRQAFFRGELLALLKLIDRGDLQAQGSPAPGPAPSGIRSSCPAPTHASPSMVMAMAAAIWSAAFPMRWRPPPTTSSAPAGAVANRGAWKSAFPPASTPARPAAPSVEPWPTGVRRA